MTRMGLFLVVAAACIAASVPARSSEEFERVNVVTDRKMLMFEMQDAYLSLLSMRQGGSSGLAQAAADTQSISENIDGFVELLLPDTAVGQVPNSRAKPEVWTEREEFAAAVDALKEASAKLAEVAAGGDVAAFDQQFDAFSQACLGCHGLKPSSEGRFRVQK